MSLNEMVAELSSLTVAERQFLVRRALDLDEPELSTEDIREIERRLEDHHRDPSSALSLDEMKKRLHARFGA